jgi:hypothetical protein
VAFNPWRWFTELFSDSTAKDADTLSKSAEQAEAAVAGVQPAQQVNGKSRPTEIYVCTRCGYRQESALSQDGGLCQSCKATAPPDPELVSKVVAKLKFNPEAKPTLLGSIREALNAYPWDPSTREHRPSELPIIMRRIWDRLSPADRTRLHAELVEKGYSSPPTLEMLKRWGEYLLSVQHYKSFGAQGPGERGNRPQFFLGGAPGTGKKR